MDDGTDFHYWPMVMTDSKKSHHDARKWTAPKLPEPTTPIMHLPLIFTLESQKTQELEVQKLVLVLTKIER